MRPESVRANASRLLRGLVNGLRAGLIFPTQKRSGALGVPRTPSQNPGHLRNNIREPAMTTDSLSRMVVLRLAPISTSGLAWSGLRCFSSGQQFGIAVTAHLGRFANYGNTPSACDDRNIGNGV